jgi:hypothetical protein
MQFDDGDLTKALASGFAATDPGIKAKAHNLLLEQGVSNARRVFFETESFGSRGASWTDLANLQADYVGQYVKTSIEQPHTFQDAMSPNGAGDIDDAQVIVRLESLSRPMSEFGCTFEELRKAHDEDDSDFLLAFCEVWNERRDFRPAFSTLLSEVHDELDQDDWADALRDRLGLAHYSPSVSPEPVALCRYSVADVRREAVTGFPITMPTVFDSDPWEYYFPAPKSLQFGRAMALTPCEGDEDLKLEFLNSRVTYTDENIWKVGQIMTPAPSYDIKDLRERHLLAVQFASSDLGFGT